MSPAPERPAEAAPGPAPPPKKRSFSVGPVLPYVSLAIALFSLYNSEVTKSDVSRLDTIRTEYGLFHDLAQLEYQNPVMLHLFTITPRTYDMATIQVKKVSTGMSEVDRAKALLQERAIAHIIFTTFEETFELWSHTTDAQRKEMAAGSLDYFVRGTQSNPRLLWYWDENGGNLRVAFDSKFQEYFQDHILNGGQAEQDANGPLGTEGGKG